MNKLFLDRNKSAPFVVKKKVLDACFSATLLYGCEGWLGVKPSPELNAFYMKSIKLLLGVRQSTSNKICLVESGYPSLEACIRTRQKAFFEKMIAERSNMNDDPLMFAIDLTHRGNARMSNYINGLAQNTDILKNDICRLRVSIYADSEGLPSKTMW